MPNEIKNENLHREWPMQRRQRVTTLLADLSGYCLSPCVTELAQFARDVLPEAAGVS
jgi:hypothetical protein